MMIDEENTVLQQAQEIKARRAREQRDSGDHEPPFDGKACPMCPGPIRNLSAVVHNFLWRWKGFLAGGDSCKVGYKLEYIREAVKACEPLITSDAHDAVKALHAAAKGFVEWFDRWQNKTTNHEANTFALQRLREEYTPKLQQASDAIEPLSQTHFADRLHSHGEIR